MPRQTIKYLKACYLIAVKYHKQMSEVMRNETSAKNVYAELELDGLRWNSALQQWETHTPEPSAPPFVPTLPPAPAPSAPSVRVRLTADHEQDLADALYYVSEALKQAGYAVGEPSRIYPNNRGDGA